MKIKQYRLHCKTATALHIGTQQSPDDVADSLFRRTSSGQILMPGTGIAGAIRSHLTRIIPAMTGFSENQIICEELSKQDDLKYSENILYHLMGDSQPDRTTETRASRLIVNDGIVNTQVTQIRDGVGIDRTTGTASRQAQSKFDIETLPINSCVTIVLELEDYDTEDEYLLELAISEWNAGRIRFGGNSSRGLGKLAIETLEVREYDLSDPQDLMNYLENDDSSGWQLVNVIPTPKRKPAYFGTYRTIDGAVQHWVNITFEIVGQGFFLTNDMTHAVARDFSHYSITSPDKTPFIPGSGMRGVMRSQAERIARTIINNRVNNEQDFLAHVPASDPFVMEWTKYQEGIESTASRIHRHIQDKDEKASPPVEWFDLSEQLFGTTFHGSRLRVSDALFSGVEPVWKKLDFVAIDRFTGGAANNMKFDAYALWKPRFSCELYLESPQNWELGWLLQVIQDMKDGLVTIGFGAAKGFGEVCLDNLNIQLGYAHPEAFGLNLDIQSDTFFSSTTVSLDDALAHWRDSWLAAVKAYNVPEHLPHNLFPDPYWGEKQRDYPLSDLYDKTGGA